MKTETVGAKKKLTPFDIADAIRKRVETGEIKLGEKLKAAELAKHYGVSRSPIREALQILAATHIVKIEYDRGASVIDHKDVDTIERIEIWGTMFSLAVTRATLYGTPQQKKKLLKQVNRLPEIAASNSGLAGAKTDEAITNATQTIYEMAKSIEIVRLVATYSSGLAKQAWRASLDEKTFRTNYAKTWCSICNAIADGDKKKARNLAIKLLEDGKLGAERVIAVSTIAG